MVSKCMGRKSAVGFWEIMGYVSKMKEVPRRGEKERSLKWLTPEKVVGLSVANPWKLQIANTGSEFRQFGRFRVKIFQTH